MGKSPAGFFRDGQQIFGLAQQQVHPAIWANFPIGANFCFLAEHAKKQCPQHKEPVVNVLDIPCQAEAGEIFGAAFSQHVRKKGLSVVATITALRKSFSEQHESPRHSIVLTSTAPADDIGIEPEMSREVIRAELFQDVCIQGAY